MRCKASVATKWYERLQTCRRSAIKDGYCTQHHPDNIAARAAKRAKADINERRLFWLRAHGPHFHSVLQRIADGAPDPIALAKKAVKMVKK